jgi:hypothetical protein
MSELRRCKMLSQQEVEQAGYTVLPKGGWMYVNPEIVPRDWDDLAKSFGFDPDCKGVYLCVCGIKEESCVDME